jgi:5'-3' exonuclease
MVLADLIIDGNYILNKNVFTLHKNNLLFGALEKSLEISTLNYRKWFPFANIYFVSDSKEKSWRKKIDKGYKEHRKKDSTIDWSFVHETYSNFKSTLKYRGIKVLEYPHIEGDDWVTFLVDKSNSEGRSTIIVSNDYDIKQLLSYNLSPLYINIMTNEMANKQKLFLPKNYQIFINEVMNLDNNDIFNLNDNIEFINLMKSFMEKYELHETDRMEALLLKVISGDQSDNISSVWSIIKNGRKRGIGEVGAKNIIESYGTEFGELSLSDEDLFENIADLICEKKKLSKTTINSIKENIIQNMKLIHLDIKTFPPKIQKILEDEFTNICK